MDAKDIKETKTKQDNTPMTQEEKQQALIMNEDAILRALSNPNIHEEVTETIELDFAGQLIRFRIRALSEKEWDRCRERHTRYAKNRRLGGMRLPESTNTVGYHSELILTATVEEDREKLWNNQRFWKACDVITGVDMVDKLIPLAGKKAAIVERIEILSGYHDDDDDNNDSYDETVKN